jgi:calcium channel MID1
MSFPNLTPLQSRFAATLAATLLLVVLYLTLFSPRLAYAADVVHESLHGNVLIQGYSRAAKDVCLSESDYPSDAEEGYERQGLDMMRRAPVGLTSLGNNQFQQSNIKIGETQWWVFPTEALASPPATQTGLPPYVPAPEDDSSDSQLTSGELRRRGFSIGLAERSTTVYISLNTCLKPDANTTDSSDVGSFPQLEVYISVSQSLQRPGPGINSSDQTLYKADGGYMGATVQADSDVFIAVAAPNTTAYTGIYNYDIAASVDAYFHSVDQTDPFLFFIDSDIDSALLVTDNTTQAPQNSTNYEEWMNITPPYTIFANNANDTAVLGLEKSYCALSQLAQIRKGNNAIEVGMTSRGLGNKPKEQFYITGLNRSSTYYGILAMDGNSTNSGNGVVGGGGKVWPPINFSTKAGT